MSHNTQHNLDPENLDGMYPDDLREFARTTRSRNLRNYACYKADAMDARIAGRIQDALNLEAHCDRIYNALPKQLRW